MDLRASWDRKLLPRNIEQLENTMTMCVAPSDPLTRTLTVTVTVTVMGKWDRERVSFPD